MAGRCASARFRSSIETAAYARLARNAARSNFVREIEESLAGRQARARCRPARLLEGHPAPHQRLRPLPRDESRIGARASPSCRSPRAAAPTFRNTPRSRMRSRRSSAGSTGATARRPGRRSAMSIAPIRARRSPGFYRAADVALVTPLRDGMNLVAKEFVAAQNARRSRRPRPVAIRRRRRRA